MGAPVPSVTRRFRCVELFGILKPVGNVSLIVTLKAPFGPEPLFSMTMAKVTMSAASTLIRLLSMVPNGRRLAEVMLGAQPMKSLGFATGLELESHNGLPVPGALKRIPAGTAGTAPPGANAAG